ncbi:hypothetical protein LCGC14_0524080 [marine sediment metagenome]|uniref:PepSY domain-containing protein n=1 Tax=marine sediment metagenome TaxID=412755 RepID=A0A0F9V5Q0_9ZZZZ|nr:peptidase [Methylophaga sp.]HEC58139.1 peptidase [Methylophaga sp.]
MKKSLYTLIPFVFALSSAATMANDNMDLDDIKNMDKVSIETCLDAALDTVPGDARKVEFKLEEGEPVYEFDVDGKDGKSYNVECNAKDGVVTEIEREVDENDAVFKKFAKISQAEAQDIALMFHPGQVVASEREVGYDGSVTYEFDIQTDIGHEIKIDINAVTGDVEEANIELYEIGMEKE